jgi:putative spermidine/putrescine transport system permease protein
MREPRAPGFWPLALVFAAFVLFMYGPMFVIFVLSFQGPEGGLTFPMRGASLHWFYKLAEGLGTVDIGRHSAARCCWAAWSWPSPWCCRCWRAWRSARSCTGGNLLFYVTVASLIMPSIIVSLGIGLQFRLIDTGMKSMLTRACWRITARRWAS